MYIRRIQGKSEADKADRAVQLGNMGKIYRESNVTIIAACGDTADAGLSGLRPDSRKFQQEIIQVIPPEDDPVHGPWWSSTGLLVHIRSPLDGIRPRSPIYGPGPGSERMEHPSLDLSRAGVIPTLSYFHSRAGSMVLRRRHIL